MPTLLHALAQYNDLHFLVLAVLACGLACTTTCTVLSRAQAATGRAWLGWTVLAAAEFGGGAWSLHVTAALAYAPTLPVSYAPAGAVLSAAIAVGGAMAAFAVLPGRSPTAPGKAWIAAAAAALLLTGAVAGMDATALMAMRGPGTVVVDWADLAAAVAPCAVLVAAGVALMRNLRPVRRQAAAAATLTLAVGALHLAGLATATLLPGAGDTAGPVGSGELAAAVAVLGVATLLVTYALSMMDRRTSARAVRDRARLHTMVDLSFEGLVIERNGTVLHVNGRMCDLTGYDAPALVGQPFAVLVPGAAPSGAASSRTGDRHVRHRNGHLVPVELLARPIEHEGGVATAVAVRSLTRRHGEAPPQHVAQFDPLTGLANQALLAGRVADALADAGPDGAVAVLRLGLDRFGAVNDTLGRAAGDRLLVAVAERLGGLVRGTDTLARVGADEFAVVLPAPDGVAAIAVALAARIVARLAAPFVVDGQLVAAGVSVGIALHPEDDGTPDGLLRCAEVAMHGAKAGGRGTFRLFEDAMDRRLQDRRALERDLRDAVDAGGLDIHYQPLVSCRDSTIEGYEALVRWCHPVRGDIPPAVFIPVAEEIGLIGPLGRWVLEQACQAAAGWAAPVRVAVNLSAHQLRQPDLADQVLAVLARAALPPERLELEVTEGALIADPERAIDVLTALRAAGVRVSLDDFGTGYSSLSHMRRFPLDKIKIDKSFIDGMGTDAQAASVVGAVVALAHTLNLSVTAEGVETPEQLGALKTHCNQVQGYLLGRPGPGPAAHPGHTDHRTRLEPQPA